MVYFLGGLHREGDKHRLVFYRITLQCTKSECVAEMLAPPLGSLMMQINPSVNLEWDVTKHI